MVCLIDRVRPRRNGRPPQTRPARRLQHRPDRCRLLRPRKWHEKIHCSSIERQWFKNLLDLGLTDSLRKVHPEGAFYTWFDYRGAMFQRKLGLRIDHILTSPELAATLTDVTVDLETRAQERPSDHAPVIAEFDC